jgi:hypothetical protein
VLAGRPTPVAKNAWVRVISTTIASRFAIFFWDTTAAAVPLISLRVEVLVAWF